MARPAFLPPPVVREAPGRGAVVAWAGPPALLVALVVAAALVTVVGVVVAGAVGAAVGVVAGLAIVRAAPRVVLSRLGAIPARPDEEPRVRNVAEGLCATLGVSVPALYLVEAREPDAAVVGTAPRRAALVVTRGLSGELNRVELEAVLAHELVHVRRGDLVAATVAAAVLALVAPVLPAGLVERLGRLVRSEVAETLTDLAAVRVTRYPPALASALERLEAPGRRPGVERLWTSPGPEVPSVRYRIEVLREL